ncbi:pyridoxal phosphate-dependent decarboxylase family protein [Alloacidobacterium sp.]|uniref:pyridoxal phosphate-dependent decarboxylase family protein n=1 Tax=Alloacidobacterium sp. TaxID=2951999 RepID=UPI002D3CF5E6|nr:aminotransferase class V-fold PLP-dependent enzyme [Alloacidobacterium sp.]HYK35603.1 aminotransferase class V-fold PLP-dependent enzyme [Alloacidobacterium sp.]
MKHDQAVELLREALPQLQQSFAHLPTRDFEEPSTDAMRSVLAEITGRLADNYPYFHPLYAGQMLKPPHPIARAAYALAMWLNPNNHALDGGRASSHLEVEAVREIAAMFGWTEYLGHLTSGGTFANLEALWVAGELAPGKKIVASENAHYTHNRISAVLRLPFASIAADARGRMDLSALQAALQSGEVETVVVTLGTTSSGAVDPLDRILDLRQRYGFRIHVDAAYGGYFKLVSNLAEDAAQAFSHIHEADSIVVDPHKHGLQPYGCGCILFRDPSVGRLYKHDSPYTYFTSSELHLGEISLECSRAGAAATALWATQRLLPLRPDGEFANGLACGLKATLRIYERLRKDKRFLTGPEPELDILVFAVKACTLQESSRLATAVFDHAAAEDLHLALAQIPISYFGENAWPDAPAGSKVTCLRSVLMKPEHLDWVDEIWKRLSHAASKAMKAADE